jgi:hypothetical protein
VLFFILDSCLFCYRRQNVNVSKGLDNSIVSSLNANQLEEKVHLTLTLKGKKH